MPAPHRFSSYLRYQHLLPRAGRSLGRGYMYSRMAASMAYRLRGNQRRAAVERARTVLSVSEREAARVVQASLVSEARAEADALYCIQHNREFTPHLPDAADLPFLPRRIVFALMGTGFDDFAYAYLRKICRLDVRAVRAPVDGRLASRAEHEFDALRRKWLWIQLGVDRLGTEDDSIDEARSHLDAGQSLIVPYGLLEEQSPITALLREDPCPVVPMVLLRGADGLRVRFGVASTRDGVDPLPAAHEQMAAFIRRWPDHWTGWMESRPVVRLVPRPALAGRALPGRVRATG